MDIFQGFTFYPYTTDERKKKNIYLGDYCSLDIITLFYGK